MFVSKGGEMERRHDDILTARLEDALLNGCSHISYPELYLWYDVKKIAAGTWRDLTKRWEELSKNRSGQLMTVEGRNGIFIFAQKKVWAVNPDRE
jgi:hypothetical protein